MLDDIRTVHGSCAAFDAYYKTETAETIKKEASVESASDVRDVPNYPEEEINPDDLPF